MFWFADKGHNSAIVIGIASNVEELSAGSLFDGIGNFSDGLLIVTFAEIWNAFDDLLHGSIMPFLGGVFQILF